MRKFKKYLVLMALSLIFDFSNSDSPRIIFLLSEPLDKRIKADELLA
jgi:hypothetical protein